MKQFSLGMIVFITAFVAANDRPCKTPHYSQGVSYVLPLKYQADFPHFTYANPRAPKGRFLRLPDMGTFDNFNNILEKGHIAAGIDFVGFRTLVYDRLLEPAIDEPASQFRWLVPLTGYYSGASTSSREWRNRDTDWCTGTSSEKLKHHHYLACRHWMLGGGTKIRRGAWPKELNH